MSEQIKETAMTDIQKMIEEERKRYDSAASNFFSEMEPTIAKAEFASGANFVLYANRWRKVSQEFPEGNKNLILETKPNLKTQPVLIKTVGGGLFVDYRVNTIHENLDGWVNFWNWTRFNNNQVTEWKPIE